MYELDQHAIQKSCMTSDRFQNQSLLFDELFVGKNQKRTTLLDNCSANGSRNAAPNFKNAESYFLRSSLASKT